MAKRGIITHRKTRRLSLALGVSIPSAVGILECLWHVASEQALRGDVGRLSNRDIAEEMFYDGDPDALVDALVSSGWLDPLDGPDRLYVHDWHEHCDRYVNVALIKKRQNFANGHPPRTKESVDVGSHEATPENGTDHESASGNAKGRESARGRTKEREGTRGRARERTGTLGDPIPSPSPSPSPSPNPPSPQGGREDGPPDEGRSRRSRRPAYDPSLVEIPEELDSPGFREAWAEWIQHRREKRDPLTPKSVAAQLAFLSEQPDPAATIRQSIRNTWKGLFEVRKGKEPPSPLSTPSTRRMTPDEVLSRIGEHFDLEDL